MITLYNTIRDVFIYATAIAAILAGFNIYQKFSRGEAVQPLIIGWLFGITVSNLLFWAVDYFILGNRLQNNAFVNPVSLANDLSKQVYQACLILGVIISVLALITIYRKYTEGEEVTTLVFQWIGSIIFLFSFGTIISAML
jgi:Domain of unknown function (DUF4134)